MHKTFVVFAWFGATVVTRLSLQDVCVCGGVHFLPLDLSRLYDVVCTALLRPFITPRTAMVGFTDALVFPL